ncbi:hypothetical protein LTS08_007372 [Lithohypha guttulata]|uniref:uncharacterized protein n=1 Tax=Lithohypha guttulata TaxID=1690604 RepID=UPI002DE0828D|nr:hypothetical protein LTR51_002209 [Lithohypha guttulata]KAK5096882.1 hypothetical protein LTS08_007372 [Lithohypha guttulata]
MQLSKSFITFAIVAASSVVAHPVFERKGPAHFQLQAVKSDIAILKTAVDKAVPQIRTAVEESSSGAAFVDVNAKVNANLRTIFKASSTAGSAVALELAEAATEITAPEARALKANVQTLASAGSKLAAVFEKTAAAEASATNSELTAEKNAIFFALGAIVKPLKNYADASKAIGGEGAADAVVELRSSAAEAYANMKAVVGASTN